MASVVLRVGGVAAPALVRALARWNSTPCPLTAARLHRSVGGRVDWHVLMLCGRVSSSLLRVTEPPGGLAVVGGVADHHRDEVPTELVSLSGSVARGVARLFLLSALCPLPGLRVWVGAARQ